MTRMLFPLIVGCPLQMLNIRTWTVGETVLTQPSRGRLTVEILKKL